MPFRLDEIVHAVARDRCHPVWLGPRCAWGGRAKSGRRISFSDNSAGQRRAFVRATASAGGAQQTPDAGVEGQGDNLATDLRARQRRSPRPASPAIVPPIRRAIRRTASQTTPKLAAASILPHACRSRTAPTKIHAMDLRQFEIVKCRPARWRTRAADMSFPRPVLARQSGSLGAEALLIRFDSRRSIPPAESKPARGQVRCRSPSRTPSIVSDVSRCWWRE